MSSWREAYLRAGRLPMSRSRPMLSSLMCILESRDDQLCEPLRFNGWIIRLLDTPRCAGIYSETGCERIDGDQRATCGSAMSSSGITGYPVTRRDFIRRLIALAFGAPPL